MSLNLLHFPTNLQYNPHSSWMLWEWTLSSRCECGLRLVLGDPSQGQVSTQACLALDKCDSMYSSGSRVADISGLCHLSAQLNSSFVLLKQSPSSAQASLKLQRWLWISDPPD